MVQVLIFRIEELLLLGGIWEEPAQKDCIRNQPSSRIFLVVFLSFIPVQRLCLYCDLFRLQEKMGLRREAMGTSVGFIWFPTLPARSAVSKLFRLLTQTRFALGFWRPAEENEVLEVSRNNTWTC